MLQEAKITITALGGYYGDMLSSLISLSPLQPCKESRLFPALVVSRVVFIPLLMLCNVQSRSSLPVYFSHDAAFTVIMALFSLSSGYLVCLSMSYAPQWVAQFIAVHVGCHMTHPFIMSCDTSSTQNLQNSVCVPCGCSGSLQSASYCSYSSRSQLDSGLLFNCFMCLNTCGTVWNRLRLLLHWRMLLSL